MLQRTFTNPPALATRSSGRRRGRAIIASLAAVSFALGAAACSDDEVDDVNDELDSGIDDIDSGIDELESEIDDEVSD